MSHPVRILAITSWAYAEGLIQSAVLPYVPIILSHLPEGSTFAVITQEKKETGKLTSSVVDEVIPLRHHNFGWRAMLANLKVIATGIRYVRKHKVSYIHAWCTPAGMNAYFIAKLTGARLVLDSFEPHADPMVEGGAWTESGMAYRILKRYERLQLKQSYAAICNVESFIADSKARYNTAARRYFVKPACVDLERFNPETATAPQDLEQSLAGKVVCIYAGKFGGLYLERETFDFLKTAEDKWGDRFRLLLLSGHTREEIAEYCRQSGFDENKIVHRFVPYAEVANYMKLADFAICPMKPLPSRRYATPVKDGEYWAMGLPVVITKGISDDSDIIAENNAGYVLQDLNRQEYTRAVDTIETLLGEEPRSLKNRIRNLAVKYRSFRIAEAVYSEIYGRRTDDKRLKN